MNNNEFRKDTQAIMADLSGSHVEEAESILKPPKRMLIYKIMAYLFIVLVLIIFGIMIAKSLLKL